ncbi:MAG TPA: UvrD-helicase domain-containing protein [Bacteroidales bacterium]|nr:UvrD-helicase domain-containing protein [Deltaproteobacteria bacterium]HOY73844.1 UvrD-helicase domain-containing protein [Deltaproteobacteria bacterium]HPH51654.1 UvrD-helicase domain-containing protein [Deltaproteobacteria bacterium]HPO40037.1 UvrD-helicase domain-containing protein [Bacteroidales bacterium]
MSPAELIIIPAGAGSGKTYTIQKQLARWVIEGRVAPEKIVAVTFTESAAAELQDRIRAELVSQGRLEEALRLEQAYISTIHSFGLRLITGFAFDAGITPQPRKLNDDEQGILIRLALATTQEADEVMGNLSRHGYRYDFNTDTGPEEAFRDRILLLMEKLRSIGRFEKDETLVEHSFLRIGELYEALGDRDIQKQALRRAIEDLLRAFPEDLSSRYADVKSASDELRKNFRDMKRALAGSSLDEDWKLWQDLRSLRVSNKKTKLPPGYDDLAAAVMAAAGELPRHAGPLGDALDHVEALLNASQDALQIYSQRKRERGLVDYTDMLAISHRLLSSVPEIMEYLRSRVDCLIIDEFQDTNPLQFSLLWSLHTLGVPTLIVGDVKQAIMGFQHADHRLLLQLQKTFSSSIRPLEKNWRSTPGLMAWINTVSARLFGDGYTPLEPQAKYPSSLAPLEAIVFRERPERGNMSITARHTSMRVRDLLLDGSQEVYDRQTKGPRRLRGGDIAMLCPSHVKIERYAEELRSLGIRCRVEEDGWFDSRVVQIACHALDHVADPSDRHAGLYLAVTELGSHTLESALTTMVREEDLSDPVLASLEPLTVRIEEYTVDEVLDEVIAALDLFGKISVWPDAAQARANLLRLRGEAAEFMRANREALASGGYYGSGVKTFLSWVRAKVERDDKQPDPRVIDEDAVTITTWHRAKGREWPVVVVCGTDADTSPRLPDFRVVYTDFNDLNSILDRAFIEAYPDFHAPETRDAFMSGLADEARDNAIRLLYVALTRAREKLVLECPCYDDKSGTESFWTVLERQTGITVGPDRMTVAGSEFDCLVTMATKHYPEDLDLDGDEPAAPLPRIGRRAITPHPLPQDLTPEAVSPSSLHDPESRPCPGLRRVRYGDPLDIAVGADSLQRGTILHRCFEVGLAGARRLNTVFESLCPDLGEVERERVSRSIEAFRDGIETGLSPAGVSVEVPVLGLDEKGSVVSGIADMVVETDKGIWIVDHKSDQVEDLQTLFSFYLPQLRCYADIVGKARPGKPVIGVAINWISHGELMMLPMELK